MIVELIVDDYRNGKTARVDGAIRVPPKGSASLVGIIGAPSNATDVLGEAAVCYRAS